MSLERHVLQNCHVHLYQFINLTFFFLIQPVHFKSDITLLIELYLKASAMTKMIGMESDGLKSEPNLEFANIIQ